MIGTGPGDPCFLAPRALELLNKADAIAGYTTYVDLLRPVIGNKPVIATGMTREIERVNRAIDEALSGKSCAVISGGDAGIYAMAGLVFELLEKRGIDPVRPGGLDESTDTRQVIQIEIVPGIPALAAGAALLGAPLTHDFATISLSDLLTDWTTIERRLKAAAEADFVIVIYNPKSKKRNWQLERARSILLEVRSGETPVGIVTGAMRDNQEVNVTTLSGMETSTVGMQTILFIGNSSTRTYKDFMYTPRGYFGKYEL